MQDVQKFAPLHIAVRMLPQPIAGIIWSYVGQALIDKVGGTILMGIGGAAYLTGASLLIFIRQDTSYWKLLFPALCITVFGADFQFIVSNVSTYQAIHMYQSSNPHSLSSTSPNKCQNSPLSQLAFSKQLCASPSPLVCLSLRPSTAPSPKPLKDGKISPYPSNERTSAQCSLPSSAFYSSPS